MEDYTHTLVIDADGHVNEGDIDFAPWLPEKYKSLAPVRLKDNRGRQPPDAGRPHLARPTRDRARA